MYSLKNSMCQKYTLSPQLSYTHNHKLGEFRKRLTEKKKKEQNFVVLIEILQLPYIQLKSKNIIETTCYSYHCPPLPWWCSTPLPVAVLLLFTWCPNICWANCCGGGGGGAPYMPYICCG